MSMQTGISRERSSLGAGMVVLALSACPSNEPMEGASEAATGAAGDSSSTGEESDDATSGESSTTGATTTGSTLETSSSGSQASGTSGTSTTASTGTSNSSESDSEGPEIVGMLEDLQIEPNPHSVLSAWVSWTTAEPADSRVQFGAGALEWEIEGEAGVTEHRVLVIGLHADTTYAIRASSTGANGTLEGTGSFTTGTLPAQIPEGTISVHDPDRAQPGWTLMNVQQGDGTNRAFSGAPPAAVIYDDAGKPVWYFIHGTTLERGGAISVDPTDRGVLMGPSMTPGGGAPSIPPIEVDWAGETLWTCEDPLCGVPDQLSHHAGKLSNGNYVVMRDQTIGSRVSQVFLEFSPNSAEPIHQVGLEDAMTPPAGASGDWAHGNAITVDLDQDVAFMSFRWLGVIKVQYSTGALLWHLPASYGQETLGVDFGDMTFVPPTSQFSDIHDPEIHDDGTILIFDNGGFSGVIEDGNPRGLQTRALEYAIDEAAHTATLVWEWPGSFPVDEWYTTELYVPFWGDADRLENGNVLITAGRRGVADTTPESRLIEVTKDSGEVVWEFRFPKDFGVYRSERLALPPFMRRIGP